MPQVRVQSVEVLMAAKAAIAEFIAECTRAVMETDAEALRAADYLAHDAAKRWEREERARSDSVAAAKAEVRKKQLTSMSEHPSLIEEKKAVIAAQHRLAEAGEKRAAAKRWRLVMEKEIGLYRGQVQALNEALVQTLPRAMARLDQMADAVHAYAALSSPSADSAASSTPGAEASSPASGGETPGAPSSPAAREGGAGQ